MHKSMLFVLATHRREYYGACGWASQETPTFMDLDCSLSRSQQPNQLWRSVAGLSPRRTAFGPRSDHVGFLVDNVALGRVSLQVLWFSLVRMIPSLLCILPYICYRRSFTSHFTSLDKTLERHITLSFAKEPRLHPPCLFKVHFNIIVRNGLLTFVFSEQNFILVSHVSRACYMFRPSYRLCFYHNITT